MTHRNDPMTARSDSTLAYLQELLLTAALLGERLPGARRPLRFLVGGGLRGIPSKIVRTNLAQSLKLDELPQRLDILSLDELERDERMTAGEELNFLAFRPADWQEDRVEIALVVGGLRRVDSDWQCRELGRVNAAFHETDGRWAAITDPHVFLEPDY
jgi:hypothetical protein